MKDFNQFLTRVNKIIEHYNLNVSSFARRIGTSVSSINSLYVRNTEPNYKTCVAILESFENISAEWLMRGKGEMLLSENTEVSDLFQTMESEELHKVAAKENLQKSMAKIKMMLRGCLSAEDYELVAEEIDKVVLQ